MRKFAMVAVLALVTGSAYAGSLGLPNELGNGGFETGTFPPWQKTGAANIFNSGDWGVPGLPGSNKWAGVVVSWGGDWGGPIGMIRQIVDQSQFPGWDPLGTQTVIGLQFDRLLKAVSGDTWRDVGMRVYLDWMEDGSYPYPGEPEYVRQLVYEQWSPGQSEYPGPQDWVHEQIEITLPAQPQFLSVEVEFYAHYAMWSFLGIDNVDLESYCIPEPATMGLLMLGLPLVRRRR